MKSLIAFRIWIIAVVANTFLGTAWLTHFFIDADSISIFIFWGFVFGMMASFPIFLLLLFIINRSVSKNETGKIIFAHVLASGIILSAISFLIFFYCCPFVNEDIVLFLNTLFSSVISVFSQKKSLMRLGEAIQFDSI